MQRLILVRHGETDWNAERRVQGNSDIPLNAIGEEQARLLTTYLATEAFDRVLSSDLIRARETARLSLSIGTEIETTPDLRELNFGDWEGLTAPDIEVVSPGRLGNVWRGRDTAPNGESLTDMAVRLERVVTQLREEILDDPDAQGNQPIEGRTTLIVSHGGALRVFICLAMDLPVERAWQFELANTAVSELRLFTEGAILSRVNDTRHLAHALR